MLNRIIPDQAGNAYEGYKAGLWIFGALVLIKTAMSLNSVFNAYSVATSADGIPLETFPPAAAHVAVRLLATWGLAHLTIAALCAVVILKYRNLIPLMCSVMFLELLSRKLVLAMLPGLKSATQSKPHAISPGYVVNWALLVLFGAGFILSLLNVRRQPERGV